ncbi:hypothetical protein NPX13_g9505 [Xylaria arbuscula]|uniref:Fungal N-terminal domain-containing protein n=1 Tax=Xylaria arbuscula TaxID=114810 RepID=A0A9W8N6L4_9PEZI|nr:hypothetical protein NPX13_g9505 [Xylaria arbuscula]
MDPLSIAAAVAGLLAFGGKLVPALWSILDKADNIPSFVQSLLQEVNDISAILSQLENYIQNRLAISQERGVMIPLKHVVASLTGCVITYSDLQQQLDRMNLARADGSMSILNRLGWERKKTTFSEIVQRLQNHKASMSLMLTILQCQALQEAEASALKLHRAFENTLRDNEKLSERIRCLEQQGNVSSIAGPSEDAGRATSLGENISLLEDDNSTIRSKKRRFGFQSPTNIISRAYQPPRAAFESDLEASRAYQRAVHDKHFSVTSLPSTALHSTAMSIFSSLSLDQLSNLSVFALPVFSSDLSNSHYYSWSGLEYIPQTPSTGQLGSAAI